MSQKSPMNDEELRATLDKYGICRCGRHKDSPNFAYHVCIGQGLLYDIKSLGRQITLEVLESLYDKRQLVIVDESTSVFMVNANDIKHVIIGLKQAKEQGDVNRK